MNINYLARWGYKPIPPAENVYDLPDGSSPFYFSIWNNQGDFRLTVSGSGHGDTIYSVSHNADLRLTVRHGFSQEHMDLADAIVNYMQIYKDDMSTGFKRIVQDFDLV